MATAWALKMVAAAVCVAMLLVQSCVGSQPAYPALGGGACLSPETTCRVECRAQCNKFSETMCQTICALTPPLAKTCVDEFLLPCMQVCKNACDTGLVNP